MDNETYEKYKKAGNIAANARAFGVDLIKPGISFLEVAEKVESKIIELGGGIAFPVNISLNEIAAHYSPRHDDSKIFKKGDLVKLDIGAHIDGFIADTAITIEIETNNFTELIKASSDALSSAIDLMKPGIKLSEIGKAVEGKIKSYHFNPIENLTGHSMKRYNLHAGLSVPSVSGMGHNFKPKEGDVLAIEPFATDGSGHVIAGPTSNIYICKRSAGLRLIRDRKSKLLYERALGKFKTLPFAQRWFEHISSNCDIDLRKLSFLGLIKQYPQLIEEKKGFVSQKEHTVILTDEGCEVMT